MIRFAIHRPVAISMLFLALVIVGAVSLKRIPVDLLPSITYPRLTVVTSYENMPAQDLERLVTQTLEEVVTALSGVRRVVSRTREGVSIITIEYEWGTEMDFANLHLREAVDRVAFRQDFPEQAERPVILRWDPTSRPISILALRGHAPLQELTDFADEVVKPALVAGMPRIPIEIMQASRILHNTLASERKDFFKFPFKVALPYLIVELIYSLAEKVLRWQWRLALFN